jgi:hypothetical protein
MYVWLLACMCVCVYIYIYIYIYIYEALKTEAVWHPYLICTVFCFIGVQNGAQNAELRSAVLQYSPRHRSCSLLNLCFSPVPFMETCSVTHARSHCYPRISLKSYNWGHQTASTFLCFVMLSFLGFPSNLEREATCLIFNEQHTQF